MSDTTNVETPNTQVNPLASLDGLAVNVEPAVPYTQPSDPMASPEEQHKYEKLAAATTDEEKLKILEENQKKPEVKVSGFRELLTQTKVESKNKIEALHAELQAALPEDLPVEEPTDEVVAPADYVATDDATTELVKEYEDLKEYKIMNEMEKKVKDNFIAQLQEQNSTISKELIEYKSSSVILNDQTESSFISAKRAMEKEPTDSNKYFYLFMLDKELQKHGITIKPDIDKVFSNRMSKGSPTLGQQQPKAESTVSKLNKLAVRTNK